MIKLSNGHSFEYMAASGALGFDGKGWLWEQPLRWVGLLDPTLFTTVTKTLTLKLVKGELRWYNPFRCMRFIKDGVVNAVSLSNPGIEWWARKIGSVADSKKIPLIASIFGKPEELAGMARILNDFDLVGLEINDSCPNVSETRISQNVAATIKSCEAIKRNSSLPLILKISVIHDPKQLVNEIDGLVEAISINSVPWEIIFPDQPSPLAKYGGGGVSGKIIQPFTWSLVRKLAQMTPIPVIGPSIWDFSDIEKVRKLGAKAVSFGSVFLRYPWRPTLYIKKSAASV